MLGSSRRIGPFAGGKQLEAVHPELCPLEAVFAVRTRNPSVSFLMAASGRKQPSSHWTGKRCFVSDSRSPAGSKLTYWSQYLISRLAWRPSCFVSRLSWRHSALLLLFAWRQSILVERASCLAA